MNSKKFNQIRWASFAVAILVPFIAWAQLYSWQFFNLTIYQVFPLLGLWAFAVMCTHFMLAGARAIFTNVAFNPIYSKVTSYVVLACILLHPGLIGLQLYLDDYGLPPGSTDAYVGASLMLAIDFGVIGVITFLSYEFFVRFKKNAMVTRYWFWIMAAQVAALGLIFVHSLQLGGLLQAGWFLYFWYILGLATAAGALLTLKQEWQNKKTKYAPEISK